MKKLNDDDLLSSKRLKREYHLFYQLWNELLYDKTMSSYRYRLMNALSCLEELRDVINLEFNNSSLLDMSENIKDCSLEAVTLINEDIVIQKHYKTIKNALLPKISCKISTDHKKREKLYTIEYAIKEIAPDYARKLFEELEEAIATKNNDTIILCTKLLVTYCVYKGWSPNALYYASHLLNNSLDDNSRWYRFKSYLLRSKKKYNVYFPLNISDNFARNQDEYIFRSENITLVQSIHNDLKDGSNLQQLYGKLYFNTAKYIEIPVFAFDPYSASLEALRKISNTFNLMTFYNRIYPWNIRGISWAVLDTSNNKIRTVNDSDIFGKYDQVPIEINSRLYKAATKIIMQDVQQNIHDELGSRFMSVISYVNMAKRSYSFEERFINFWFGLESFSRSDVYPNIISSVLELIPAVMCIRYIYKLLHNFIQDIKRCTVDISSLCSDEAGREEQVINLFEVLRDSTKCQQLKEKCAEKNQLLAYRCSRLAEMVSDHKKMINKVNEHHTKVEQHISRLYRIRNRIAHSASTTDNNIFLSVCTTHLEEYLVELLNLTIFLAEKKDEHGVKCIFEMIKDNYRVFKEEAKTYSGSNNTDSMPKMEEFLRTGIMRFI